MKRTIIMAAAAAALFALSAPAPAQASMANPGLSAALGSASPLAQNAQFQVYIGSDGRQHRRYRRYHQRYRHCWNHRYRVRYGHHWVWRTVRRCSWR